MCARALHLYLHFPIPSTDAIANERFAFISVKCGNGTGMPSMNELARLKFVASCIFTSVSMNLEHIAERDARSGRSRPTVRASARDDRNAIDSYLVYDVIPCCAKFPAHK